MSDERLGRDLRSVDGPATPRPEFADALFEQLVDEQRRVATSPVRRLPHRSKRPSRGLALVAAAVVLGVGVLGYGLIGERPDPPPSTSLVPPSPVAEKSSRRSPTAPPSTPIPTFPAVSPLAPSLAALHDSGMVVYEHRVLGEPERLKYFIDDHTSAELLPDVQGTQVKAAWSPDGTRLAFTSRPTNDPTIEKILETDAHRAKPRDLSADCVRPTCLGESDPAYDPNGRRLAFIRKTATIDGRASAVVAIRDLQSGEVIELASTRQAGPTWLLHPAWSPDGRSIAYGVATWGTDLGVDGASIWVVTVEDSDLHRLTPAELDTGDPVWSPDGTRILFSTEPIRAFEAENQRPIDSMHLYTIAPDGTGLREFALQAPVGGASFVGGGTQIVYTSFFEAGSYALGVTHLMVMDADGGNVRTIAANTSCCSWYAVQQPTP